MVSVAPAKTVLNVDDPVEFFTTVADKMLKSTFSFGVTNIPVYSNGVFVYNPAVQRLLQLSANIYDASTNHTEAYGRNYPSVFRPLFTATASGDLFITGYTNVSSVTGADDSALAIPLDAATVATVGATNLLVNIYGVPWIIGAKKGFPNFNEFSMESVVQITRKLQVTRTNSTGVISAGVRPTITGTNQIYIFSITNYLGAEFWNSYTNNYTNDVQVFVRDNLCMTLTNEVFNKQISYAISSYTNIQNWPGWTNSNRSSFVLPMGASGTNLNILPASAYQFGLPGFVDVSLYPGFEIYPPIPLPQFGLLMTNCLQVFMLETDINGHTHLIDYAHFSGPESTRNLNAELADPDSTGIPAYLWSTNFFGIVPWGVVNQLNISRGASGAIPPDNGGSWQYPSGLPPGLRSGGVLAMKAYFDAFFKPNSTYTFNGTNYVNQEFVVQTPYTPTRYLVDYVTWQANDPLAHYLSNDLYYSGNEPSSKLLTGLSRWAQMPDVLSDLGYVNQKYQPWGRIHLYYGSDTNAYNLAVKDSLVWNSDDWNFPAGDGLPLFALGRIHRGTPWQTVYLKASNILNETTYPAVNIGISTWASWTGEGDLFTLTNTAPINDWKLVEALVSLMNTNPPEKLMSVNNNNLAHWSAMLIGKTVITNTSPNPNSFLNPAFDWLTIGLAETNGVDSSVGQLVTGINLARAYFTNPDGVIGTFEHFGDILSVPQLTEQSPFLNWNNANQQHYGISDEAYEAIPNQLLPLLRPDSIGRIIQTNGSWNIQFSGLDDFTYALQTSTNCVDWELVSTNCPVHGFFQIPISPSSASQAQFFRSVLLP